MRDGVGFNLINQNGFKAGPVANIGFPRRESYSRYLRALGNVNFTIEAGGFATYMYGPVEIGGEVRRGLGGHDGTIAEFKATLYVPISGTVLVGGGPTLKLADDTYMNAYYGISEHQSERSGKAMFIAGPGLLSAGVNAFGVVKLTDKIHLLGFIEYEKLLGDAAESPIVKGPAGSENQFSGGAAVTYRFSWR